MPTVPAGLVIAARDDPAIGAWLAGLDARIATVSQRWDLLVSTPYEPGGMTAWVAPARTRTGTDVVVKVAWRHYESAHEVEALRLWGGDGAVHLLDSASLDAQTDVLLLERCLPGTSAAMLDRYAADEVVAGTLRRLWVRPPEPHPFRPLRQMCADWLAAFDFDDAVRRFGDPGIVRAGAERFAALAAEPAEQVLLATDLHAGNILAAQREPWLAIDPKPYVGDRTFDALQHLLNDESRLRGDLRGFIARMAGLLDLEPARVSAWLFARCVVEVRWFPAAADVARALA